MIAAQPPLASVPPRDPPSCAAFDAPGTEIVHVVDSHEAARHSLCLLLRVNGLRAHAYASVSAFLDEAEPTGLGCVIVDSGHATSEVLDLITGLKARCAGLPVIVVTSSGDVSAAVAAMRAGAFDLFEKPFDSDALFRSVYRALDRQRSRHSSLSGPMPASVVDARLSPREVQVFERVATGKTNKEIARELGISPRTVEIYRAAVMTKLDVSSKAELVRVWLQQRGWRRSDA